MVTNTSEKITAAREEKGDDGLVFETVPAGRARGCSTPDFNATVLGSLTSAGAGVLLHKFMDKVVGAFEP